MQPGDRVTLRYRDHDLGGVVVRVHEHDVSTDHDLLVRLDSTDTEIWLRPWARIGGTDYWTDESTREPCQVLGPRGA